MENAAQSSRPEARIIQLHKRETHESSDWQSAYPPMNMNLHTLEYIDQLLDEHFK